ncbi:MAG: hypothetical protein JJ863_36910 [Deltaproteobacteria bacterium]|nr:hypothetical protein [Deltaproteobacteria bacterium]
MQLRRPLMLSLALGLGCGDDGRVADDAGGFADAASPRDGGGIDGGARDGGRSDAGGDAGSGDVDASIVDLGVDGGSPDGGPPDLGPPDMGPTGPATYDVRILADGFCDMLSFDPASISVPAGTEFTVNWINATGCTEIDIDMNGTVPIVLGLESGSSYHDTIREWCGTYTGTYTFRAYYAPSYPFTLPVDCDG